MKRMFAAAASAAAIGGGLLFAQSAVAQDAGSQAGGATSDVIVVTALKRERSLQDTPASISVFSAETLEAFQLTSIRDLSRLTPNFLGSNFNSTQPIFAIRGGANTLSALGTNEPVAIYIDEVYVPRFSAGDLDLFDLESVEVLRGPQGTFFGRNVASGAIVLRTARPSMDEVQARGRIAFGNEGQFEAQGFVSGPLSDGLAGKLTVSHRERGGYGRDTITGQEQDGFEALSVRGALRWAPNARFDATLSMDYQNDENSGKTLSAIGLVDADRRTSSLGVPQDFEREIFGASLNARLSYEAGDLVSITGFRSSDSRERFSFNGLSFTLLPFAFQQVNAEYEDPQTISQEIRFESRAGERFEWIAGLFFLNENSGAITDRQRLAAGSGAAILDEVYFQSARTDAFAAFLDANFDLTDRLELSGGLRWSYEERGARLDYVNVNNPANSFLADDLDADFDAFTPRLALTWLASEAVTAYASVSTGFTAGGFNTTADSLIEIIDPFEEEHVLSWEAGVKTRFDRGYVNLAVFTQDYTDKQEFVFDPTTFIGTVRNAADATINGIEIEAGAQLTDYLRIDATYGWLDTEFDSFPIGGGPGNTGNELGNAPGQQFSVSASGERPILNGRAELFGNAAYGWTDSYFTGATNDPDLFIESYGLVSGTVGVRSADGRWSAELYGTNLLDEDYVLIPSDFIVQAEHLGPPRLFGVRLSVEY